LWYRWWAIAKCIYLDSNQSTLESNVGDVYVIT